MVSKNFMPQTGISEFSVEILLPHSTNKFRKGTLLSSTKSLVSKKIMDKGWGGLVSRLPVTIAFPHSTKSFRRRTLLCFRKFRVSKSLIGKRGGGCSEGVSQLSAKNFLSHSSEKKS